MALNLNPEKGVKLTKKDKGHILKKIETGWKSIVLIPDYDFDENGDIQVMSDNNRRHIKIVKILDDGIYIEKALKNKTLKIPWEKISLINNSNKIKNSIDITMIDGRNVTFQVYNSYKLMQIREFIINYVNTKKLENNSNIEIYN